MAHALPLLLRAQWRFLRRAPASALTALLGTTLAVASIVAVHVISVAVAASLESTRPPHLAGASHVLTHPEASAEAYFALRAAWRAGALPDVRGLVPIVEGRREIGGRQTEVIGVDWLAQPDTLTVPGKGPDTGPRPDTRSETDPPVREPGPSTRTETALADALLATAVLVDPAMGLAAGADLEVDGALYRVAGLVAVGGTATVFTDIATAQRWLDKSPDVVDWVVVVRDAAAPDSWRNRLEWLMPGITAGWPAPALQLPPEHVAFAVRAVMDELPAAAFGRAILFNVGALGMLALLVSWFLIQQVALIWAERQRVVFLHLDALGVATWQRVLAFVIAVAALGAVASIAGGFGGVGLARGLIGVIAPSSGVSLQPADAASGLKALISGLGVALVAGMVAALQVRSPRMQSTAQPAQYTQARVGLWRAVVRWLPAGSGLARIGVLMLALVVFWQGSTRDDWGLAGGFAAILAATIIMLVLVAPLLALGRARVRRPLARVDSRAALLLRVGMREALDQPRVVAVAVSALALAMATAIGVGVMIESLRSDFTRMLDARLAGDLYLEGAPQPVAAAMRWLRAACPDWRQMPSGTTRLRVARSDTPGGVPVRATYARFSAEATRRYGYRGALAPDAVIINERLARQLAVTIGDPLQVAGTQLRIVHVYPGFGDSEPGLALDLRALPGDAAPAWSQLVLFRQPDDCGGAAVADETSPTDQLAEQLGRSVPGLVIRSPSAVRARALQIFDQTFVLTRALTLLALVVAGVGVYNAILALRLRAEPARRLLVAVGASRAETRWVGLVRALLVAGMAALIAMPLGAVMAWVLCAVVNPRAFGWTIELALAGRAWFEPVLLGIGATLLAALLPAPPERGAGDTDA